MPQTLHSTGLNQSKSDKDHRAFNGAKNIDMEPQKRAARDTKWRIRVAHSRQRVHQSRQRILYPRPPSTFSTIMYMTPHTHKRSSCPDILPPLSPLPFSPCQPRYKCCIDISVRESNKQPNHTNSTMAPSPDEIKDFCSSLGTSDPSPFFNRVSKDVDWAVLGTSEAAKNPFVN